MQKLLTITDSQLYVSADNEVWLFHSVCRELNSISDSFGNQELIGRLIDNNKTQFERTKSNIIIPIEQSTVKSIRIQLVLLGIKGIIRLCKKNSATFVHVRGPSIVLFMVLLVTPLFRKKKFWFKYANIWNESGRSIFWDIQRLLLKLNNNVKVTINGHWPDLPSHIIPFENPCYYQKDIENNNGKIKIWPQKKKVVFIGRITEEKGIFRILDAINSRNVDFLSELVFIGEGADLERLKKEVHSHPYKSIIRILGSASKTEVIEHLRQAHLLLLPTTSPEGFPKVISEAWLMSCIPVTSDISSIPQYVKHGKTGFIWNRKTDNWEKVFSSSIKLEERKYREMLAEIENILPLFTYEYFSKRVVNEVFNFNV